MDEAVLAESLGRVADGAPPARPPVADLRRRVGRRRRRQRALATCGGLVVVAVGVLGAVLVADRGDELDRVTTTALPATTTTTAEPREPTVDRPATFTVTEVPSSMDAQGCSLLEPQRGLRTCGFSVPGRAVPATVNLSFVPGSATAEVRAAWDVRDADRVALLLGWATEGEASFTQLGGVEVLGVGETDRVDGSSLGLPDRVQRGYAVLVGDAVVQVGSETDGPEVASLIAGLSSAPRWAVADGVLELLPEGTVVVAQGVRSRWSEVDAMRPETARRPPVTSYGIDLVLPEMGRRGLTVEVAEGIDAGAFLGGLRSRSDEEYELTSFEGRPAVRIERSTATPEGHLLSSGTPVVARWGPQLLVAVDDDTLLSVVASSSRTEEHLDPVARQVLSNLG